MSELFLKIVNMSISASWIVVAVLALRFCLKKAPKWVNVLLWGIVAVRMVFPFSIESVLSLIPSAETISPTIMMEQTPSVQTGVPVLNHVINPVISGSLTPAPGASANPLQIWIPVLAWIWLFGIAALFLYSAVSYWRLHRKVCEAVILRGNIYQSEKVCSPFVLGIIKPKIYLPYHMDSREMDHVIAHEQTHIRRKDHWWKPLGFLLLTIHWFNPLMWLSYILLCRDIELACDEKVIREMGNEQRADYTQALVACSVNRRVIAACPLAFGEVGVKERVKSVMNYKKPTFWIVLVSVVICAVVAVCFLTNPKAERRFPISGENVSDMEPAQIVEKIAAVEGLKDSSLLCVNADNFDLQFTSDFEWANDGAIRFFYTDTDSTYSAQLRMFHTQKQYYITERTKWVEQDQIYKLSDYLNALKYMPQEEIRKLSQGADGYSVLQLADGTPSDYERVLTYSASGLKDIDGWYIHLEVLPLHKVNGAYNGSGDEAIHLFYGTNTSTTGSVEKWFDYLEKPDEMNWDGNLEIELPEYPDVTFRWYPEKMDAVTGNEVTQLYTGMPIWNTYFCDLTGDGFPDLCSTLTIGSGIIDSRIIVYDYANGASYTLEDRGKYDYSLRLNETDGCLWVVKKAYNSDDIVASGKLLFADNCLRVAYTLYETHKFTSVTIRNDGEDTLRITIGSDEKDLAVGEETSLAYTDFALRTIKLSSFGELDYTVTYD